MNIFKVGNNRKQSIVKRFRTVYLLAVGNWGYGDFKRYSRFVQSPFKAKRNKRGSPRRVLPFVFSIFLSSYVMVFFLPLIKKDCFVP